MQNNSNHFDLIIIGGGINGAGIARDCAMRGLKVLILDKGDFGGGTSSRSTKLIHGGIRYLENYEFKLVWEACHERKILTRIAPHLVRPIPFIIPVYKGDKRPLWLVKLGLFLYDLMAGFKNIHRHKNLSRQQIHKIVPNLKTEGLMGGGIYYDCQTDDARLTLANIIDAVDHGAVAKNYTEVATIRATQIDPKTGKIDLLDGLRSSQMADKTGGTGSAIGRKTQGTDPAAVLCAEVVCQDVLTAEKFTYTTKFIVNATGPWLDQNLAKWNLSQTENTHAENARHDFNDNAKIEDRNGLNKAKNDIRSVPGHTQATRNSQESNSKITSINNQQFPRPLLRLTKGIHFFVPRLTDDHAVLISAKKDNRVFFIIPHGPFSLVGTTDTDYKADPDNVSVTNEDIQYLLDELNRLFPGKNLTRKDVFGEYAGLRPLLNDKYNQTNRHNDSGTDHGYPELYGPGLSSDQAADRRADRPAGPPTNMSTKEGKVTREYQLKKEPLKGGTILHVIGGKITTYRSLAEKVTNVVCSDLGLSEKTLPASKIQKQLAVLPNTTRFAFGFFPWNSTFQTGPKCKTAKIPLPVSPLDYQKSVHVNTNDRIIPELPVTWADLNYSINHEFVRTPEDFIRRRTELYIYQKKHPELLAAIEKTITQPSAHSTL